MSSETPKQEQGVMGSMMKKVGDTLGQAKEAVLGKPAEEPKEKTAAEIATDTKDHVIEKAVEAKDSNVVKATEAKDYVVDKGIEAKDFVSEKAIEGKDIAGTKIGEATKYAQDAAGKGREMFPGNNDAAKRS
ncbi:hypothetical protein M5689_014948 [Euphorbia peplus]|nr:hypothetical protein M5689_014948 [Euphorbia peplus]